ncbi:MAG: divergent PAP2 family protein [Ignavibacteriales bacterium]
MGLLQNRAFLASTLSWITAQALKVLLSYMQHKRLDFRRFVSPGGMPSSHAASVSCLTVIVGKEYGLASTELAIVIVFALIVMYDAAGVRRAAGRQAAVLNRIVREVHALKGLRNERLRELLGHTPVEVIAGAALGIGIALIAG